MEFLRWLGELSRDLVDGVRHSRNARRRIGAGLVSLMVLAVVSLVWHVTKTADPQSAEPSGNCGQAGGRMADQLPSLDPEWVRMEQNPCLEATKLVGLVTGLLPDDVPDGASAFLKRIDGFAARVSQIQGVAECGYVTDRLAITIYQDRTNPFAVGVVAVLRGDFEAMLEISDCFLFNQVMPFTTTSSTEGPARGGLPVAPGPAATSQLTLCSDSTHRFRDGEHYRIVWIGTSRPLCNAMGTTVDSSRPTSTLTAPVEPAPTTLGGTPASPSPEDPRYAIALRNPLNLREGPSTAYHKIAERERGSTGYVVCYVEGELVDGPFGTSRYWDRIDADGQLAFVADALLDTGGDVTSTSRPCTDDEASGLVTGLVTLPELPIRAAPTSKSQKLGALGLDVRVHIDCYVAGEAQLGVETWARITFDKSDDVGYVAAAYLQVGDSYVDLASLRWPGHCQRRAIGDRSATQTRPATTK